ncbi:PREDICTED: putative disease resistance protein RGA4 [Theobroma cacao]|uniref:Disease resistance protein RGA4 n=1 Tax=Theobroma cacao TaxID=3641 RepID=A0AB32UXS8_THECC|nr:PREDICTED: putative disease resistance protein RGA4 [Theobroma cacao]
MREIPINMCQPRAMAESILYGAVSNILSLLASIAGQDLGLNFGQKKELENLRGTLTTIHAVLLDAEEKQKSDLAVKEWISWLEDVVYDVDDLLDEFHYEILRQKTLARRQVRKFFSSSNPLAFGLKMGRRLKETRERLDAVAADISKFNLSSRVAADVIPKNIDRDTASKVRSQIIGREKNKEHIVEILLHCRKSILVIAGTEGVGKTSLVQLVFNDAKIKCFFNARIWVRVSEEFDVSIIFKKMLKSLQVDCKVDDLDLRQLQIQLHNNLKGKRLLLVLDDVRNKDHIKWGKFSQYMVFGADGSKILATTRSERVAATMGVNFPYHLLGLNEDQSWALFEHVVFKGQGQIDSNLRVIGRDVVRRCKGIPLAIKCLGGLMRQKINEEHWSFVQKNQIWKLLTDSSVFLILRLSYIQLPDHLKQCFAFCSIFPKDFKISKDKLIHLWRAQGYFQVRIENENIQDIGDEYFNDLLSRSFFQEEENDAYGNIVSCKMHDLIHDFASSVASRSFYWMKDDKEDIPRSARYVSLEKNSKKVALTLSKTKGIRTMFFRTDVYEDLFIRNATFLCFNCLRMLNLSQMGIEILPNSIGNLKHLRYLDLSCNDMMKVLPNGIVKLHNLQTLLLCSCSRLKELPGDIQQLISLEYLDIDDCYELKCLPKGVGELTSLQRLDRFIVNSSVEKSFSTAATLNELRDLNDLGNCLRFENLDKVRNVELESNEANLKEKKRIRSLRLHWDPRARRHIEKDKLLLDNLRPHPNLKELVVHGYEGAMFSSWLSSLNNLVELDIDYCWNCQYLPPLDHLSSLKSLILQRFNVLEYMTDSFSLPCSTPRTSFFPSLKKLEIRECPKFKGWWWTTTKNQGSTAEQPCFPCLSKLEIRACPKLTSMPPFPSLDQDLTLIGTSIRVLQETLKMKPTEASMTSEASLSSVTLPLSNLKSLTLIDIKDLDALSEKFLQNITSLAHLTLKDCPNLESLLPQNMNCLATLQELSVINCPLQEASLGLTILNSRKRRDGNDLCQLPSGHN